MWGSLRSSTLACGLLLLLLGAGPAATAFNSADKYDWSAITPTVDLRYRPCYDGLRCARLKVPMDWHDTSGENNNKTVAIAVVSLPATVSPDDPTFGGTIITNPGGPGGSGVDFLQRKGRLLQRIADGKKHYEILSFDPRGVAWTTPAADCSRGHLLARESMMLEKQGIGGMGASERGLKRFLALDDVWARVCESTNAADGDEGGIFAHMSTAVVARDIVEIADRVEEQRKREMGAWERTVNAQQQPQPQQQPLRAAAAESVAGKTNRVLYWGFSYGTVLGNTLASMFPGRMGRVILDGNVDIYDYMAGTWLHNLFDAEEILAYFYDSCFAASAQCPLWTAEDRSGADIQARLAAFFDQADANPFTFFPDDAASADVAVITSYELRKTIKNPLYGPVPAEFEKLADVLAEALQGNFSRVGLSYGSKPPSLQDGCRLPRNDTARTWELLDAQKAILCGDGDWANPDGAHRHQRSNNTTHWAAYTDQLRQQSLNLGPYWATIAAECVGWRVQPKWRFTGPFTTPHADVRLQEGRPAAPILFTSSLLDPVTPLRNAHLLSNDHPGSAVLTLDTYGHCALGNGWSECFNAHIRAYLDDGIVPENGTVCADTACKPFVQGGHCEPPAEAGVVEARRHDDDTVWSAPRFRQPLGIPL